MKTILKHIALGTMIFLLFSQMSFVQKEILGTYVLKLDIGFCELRLKRNHRFSEKVKSCFRIEHKGKWKIEGNKVILIYNGKYKEKCERIFDTLEIKRLDFKIDSIGEFKKN